MHAYFFGSSYSFTHNTNVTHSLTTIRTAPFSFPHLTVFTMADNEPDDDLVDYDEEEVCPKIRLHLDRYTLYGIAAAAARSRSFRLRETSTISTRDAVI